LSTGHLPQREGSCAHCALHPCHLLHWLQRRRPRPARFAGEHGVEPRAKGSYPRSFRRTPAEGHRR
jgi:hypothetical protein